MGSVVLKRMLQNMLLDSADPGALSQRQALHKSTEYALHLPHQPLHQAEPLAPGAATQLLRYAAA